MQALVPPNILTIAGSDSGGGAGIQADLKTIMVLGGFGLSAITALTAQNGLGVTGIHAPDADFVALQIKTLRDGFSIASAKTGMLFDRDIIKTVAKSLDGKTFPLVVDPVCVSQSGHQLLKENAVDALKSYIVPLADLLTPNAPEAALLADIPLRSHKDIPLICERLFALGAKAVLIKGGHMEVQDLSSLTEHGFALQDTALDDACAGGYYVDWFACAGDAPVALPQAAVATLNNHGTGCTLSAAIASYLGLGFLLRDAIVAAQIFLNKALAHSYAPGLGAGPPNVRI